MHILPPRNKLILGVSSVWISSLIYDSYLNNLYIFMFLLSNITLASSIYWYEHNMNSKMYLYDLIFVKIYGLTLFYNSLYKFSLFILFIKLIIVLLFYILSDYSLKHNIYNLQLFSHLIFRYIFFIWSYIYINDYKNNEFLLFISINYFLYNYYLYKSIKTYNLYIYLRHCFQILFLNFVYLSFRLV